MAGIQRVTTTRHGWNLIQLDTDSCRTNEGERDPLHAAMTTAYELLLLTPDQQDEQTKTEHAFAQSFLTDARSAKCYHYFGELLAEQGRHAEALEALVRATELQPDGVDAAIRLGLEQVDLGQLDAAERTFRHALGIQPLSVEAHFHLGSLLGATRRPEDAVTVLKQATLTRPTSAPAHYTLASQLLRMNRHSEAEGALWRTLELDPDHAMAALQLADVLRISDRTDQAEKLVRRVAEAYPDFFLAEYALGNVLMAKGTGDSMEALDHFRRAIQLDPNSLAARMNLSYLLNLFGEDGHGILAECRQLIAPFEGPLLCAAIRHSNVANPRRRLRVGYVSPDFRDHCQTLFTLPLLRHHNSDAVEVYGYSSAQNPDSLTCQLAEVTDVWRNVAALNDEQLAHQIIEDRIDVLVDLTMQMGKGRPLLFARRPAPVQVTWLAYTGTTGSKAIDYRMTDPQLDPLDGGDGDTRYSERSIRLPDAFWCYDPLAGDIPPGPLPALRKGHITFGCLNNPNKLTDRTFALWAKVLGNVACSRLLLMLPSGQARDIVRAKFAALGIEDSRMTFISYQRREDYLRTYQDIDIALDVFPCNGHTTSLDALWMGVPVITIIGSTPTSRGCYSILSTLGLGELAATADGGFVECATALASDPTRLAGLRDSLRRRMEASPLMDGARFARNMETAYRQMWVEWCDTKALDPDLQTP